MIVAPPRRFFAGRPEPGELIHNSTNDRDRQTRAHPDRKKWPDLVESLALGIMDLVVKVTGAEID
jgi:hypothetical protein